MAFPSYGKLLRDGYSENPRPAVLRTSMESGPPKQTKIQSRVMVERPVVYQFTLTEKGTFWTWFTSTINYGADWFDWTDPVDGVTKAARIVGGQIGWQPVSHRGGSWRAAFTLETWQP